VGWWRVPWWGVFWLGDVGVVSRFFLLFAGVWFFWDFLVFWGFFFFLGEFLFFFLFFCWVLVVGAGPHRFSGS